jgi:hypothetical protein
MKKAKVHRSIRLTERQVANLEAEAYREGIPMCEALRRVVDEWIARQAAAGRPILAKRGG